MGRGTKDEREAQFNRALGHAIKERRRERELTQQQLADAVGVTRASIGNWESGRFGILVHYLPALTGALRIPVDDLVPPVDVLPPLVRVQVSTRHPEDYLLVNRRDGTQWEIRGQRWAAIRG